MHRACTSTERLSYLFTSSEGRSYLISRGHGLLAGSIATVARGRAISACKFAAAQTRIVSKARIRLDSRKSVRSFKGIICVDISEFESFSIGAGWCQAPSDYSVDLVWDVHSQGARFSSGSALGPSHDGITRMRWTNLWRRPCRKTYGR